MQNQHYVSPFKDYNFMDKMGLDGIKKYPRKTTLFKEDERYQGVYLIIDGKVKISKGRNEQQTLLWLASSKEFIGINSHIIDSSYTYTAVTLTDSTGFFIPKSKFDSLIKNYPNIKSELLKSLSKRISLLEHRTADKQFEGTKTRFINFLLSLTAKDSKSPIKVELSMTDIASLIDTTEYYLIKIVNDLKSKGLISHTKESLCIQSYKKLAEFQ